MQLYTTGIEDAPWADSMASLQKVVSTHAKWWALSGERFRYMLTTLSKGSIARELVSRVHISSGIRVKKRFDTQASRV